MQQFIGAKTSFCTPIPFGIRALKVPLHKADVLHLYDIPNPNCHPVACENT
jgi:hypothetical protein